MVGDLRVPPGSSLAIGPGCYVEFQGYYQFFIDTSAVLQALGTESDSVYFTAADTTTGWKGAVFDHADSSSKLIYCLFEFVIGASHQKVVNNLSSSFHIEHNTFTRNHVLTVISCSGHSGAVISNNIFAYNTAQEVILHFGSFPSYIIDNIFEYNNSYMLIFHFSDEIIVRENIFRHNIGLVMYSRWSIHTEFIGNIVHNNFSADLPSVFFGMDADYLIENNTVCNNISTSIFYPVGYFETEHVPHPAYMINNIFWGNVYEGDSLFRTSQTYLTVIYCDVQGGWAGGNINADPMFVDSASGDYHLLAGSPCIDAGSPFSPPDPDGTIADMGALYFDQATGIKLPDMLPRVISLHQNYPNPFNAGTFLKFDVTYEGRVAINIYDLLGRKVSSIVNGYYQAGSHELFWNGYSDSGKELPSGIYFYKLKSDTFEQTRKMMLLK